MGSFHVDCEAVNVHGSRCQLGPLCFRLLKPKALTSGPSSFRRARDQDDHADHRRQRAQRRARNDHGEGGAPEGEAERFPTYCEEGRANGAERDDRQPVTDQGTDDRGAEGGAISTAREVHDGQQEDELFDIDVLACPRCGGRLRIIATVPDPAVVRAILAHLGVAPAPASPGPAPP